MIAPAPRPPRVELFDWITVREYARIRRVSTKTVRRWIRARLVEAERIGARGQWRIRVVPALKV